MEIIDAIALIILIVWAALAILGVFTRRDDD